MVESIAATGMEMQSDRWEYAMSVAMMRKAMDQQATSAENLIETMTEAATAAYTATASTKAAVPSAPNALLDTYG